MKRLSSLPLALALLCAPALAQSPKPTHTPKIEAPRTEAVRPAAEGAADGGGMRLIATLTPADGQGLKAGLVWRVFDEATEANGKHRLVAELQEASPTIALPDGAYIVHAAYGLAGATRRSSSRVA